MAYKAGHSNGATRRFCVLEQAVARWQACVGGPRLCVARTRTPPTIGNHGAPQPPTPSQTTHL